MTDEDLTVMHSLLAKYHRNRAMEATLDVVQLYHADLAQRLADELRRYEAHDDPGTLMNRTAGKTEAGVVDN